MPARGPGELAQAGLGGVNSVSAWSCRQQSAEGGGDEDVHLCRQVIIGAGPGGTGRVSDGTSGFVAVGRDQGRAGAGKHPQHVTADPAEAEHSEAACRAKCMQRGEDADGYVLGGVTAAAGVNRPTEHVRGPFGDMSSGPGSYVWSGGIGQP